MTDAMATKVVSTAAQRVSYPKVGAVDEWAAALDGGTPAGAVPPLAVFTNT